MKKKDTPKFEGNVFVVSRLGQLRNVQNFIEEYNACNNVLIIQYSGEDSDILRNILEMSNKALFKYIKYVKLPNFPLNATASKNKKIYTSIENTVLYIKDNHDFNNLFLCNADKWYCYYMSVKKEYKLEFSINLLEEGLTTYLISDKDYSKVMIDKKINFNDVNKSIKAIIKSLKNIVKDIKNLFVHIFAFTLKIISLVIRVNLFEKIKKLISHIMIPQKYKFKFVEHFENAFVCFPDRLKQDNFTIDNINKLDFKFEVLDESVKIKDSEKYALFINQKYINYDKHFEIIFKIFEEMNLENILIKLHPRENKEKTQQIIDKYKKIYPKLNVEVLNNMDSVPVENIIYNNKFKQVLGLLSSSLIYCNGFIKGINIISIATRYKNMCYDKKNSVNLNELEQYEKEYETFIKFDGVKQFEDDSKSK